MTNALKKKIVKNKPLKQKIFSGKNGLVTKSNIERVIQRWSQRKGFVVKSFDQVIRDPHTKSFRDINTARIARRFVEKDLLKTLKNFNLNQTQLRIVQNLLSHSHQKIPKTNINLKPSRKFIILKLINVLGIEKTRKVFERLIKRASAIKRLALKESNQRISKNTKKDIGLKTQLEYYSDSFINVPQNIDFFLEELNLIRGNKEQFVNQIKDFIRQRKGDLILLSEQKIQNKEYFVKKLRSQIREANFELKRFEKNN